MDKIIKHYLENDKELIKKYKNAEERYLKKLGDNYDTIQVDLDITEEEIRKLYKALAKSEICLDDLAVSVFKLFIVKEELNKL